MQTFAHGSKAARSVPAKECSTDDHGHVCVYVGAGGHPSYADNFIGRNIFMDLVGDAYSIKPTSFIDVSRDVLQVALDLTQTKSKKRLEDQRPHLVPAAKKIPASVSGFTRYADSNPLAHSNIVCQEEVDRLELTHNHYRPFLFLTKLWKLITHLFTKSKAPLTSCSIEQLINKPYERTRSYSFPIVEDSHIPSIRHKERERRSGSSASFFVNNNAAASDDIGSNQHEVFIP
jgi:hypothetical protein